VTPQPTSPRPDYAIWLEVPEAPADSGVRTTVITAHPARRALDVFFLGRLHGSVGRLVNPFLIARPLLLREALISSRMEGTRTTAAKLVSLEAHRISDPDEDTLEVSNYMTAMYHGLSLLENLPVCLRLIREIHRELLEA
jgi:hypothetical protein